MPALAEQAGFTVVGLLATHADWDHVLGRYAFPEAPLGCAETTAARLVSEPGDAQRKMRAFDEEFYVERPRPLSLPSAQRLPVPGKLEVGDRELELHPTDGPHRGRDGDLGAVGARARASATTCRRSRSRCCTGPARERLPRDADRLEPLVEEAEHVVPGHGGPIDGTRAAAILREDRAYLEALLDDGEEAKLPLARRNGAQRKIHAENVQRTCLVSLHDRDRAARARRSSPPRASGSPPTRRRSGATAPPEALAAAATRSRPTGSAPSAPRRCCSTRAAV